MLGPVAEESYPWSSGLALCRRRAGRPQRSKDRPGRRPAAAALAVSYVNSKWPRAAAKSRKAIAEALTTVTMALLLPRRGRPDDALIRRALFGWASNTRRQTTGTPSTEIAEALAWVSSAFPRVIAA
jgi:hypothetical protein